MKWRVNSQRENNRIVPSPTSADSKERMPQYLIRREKKIHSHQQQSQKVSYTKYTFHSNQISPTSSPNISRVLKQEEQQITQQNYYPIERKHSMSTISTENRSTHRKQSPNNINLKTDSIKLITQQFTEQIITEPIHEIVKPQQNQVEGSEILMKAKKLEQIWLFSDKKKKQFTSHNFNQFKDGRKQSTFIDQVIKLVRTIKQPSYRYEAQQRQSRLWVENASFEPVILKQKYVFSQSQFKIYFSQYFDKHLKLFRIIEENASLLSLMNKYQEEIKETKQFRKSKLLLALNDDPQFEHYEYSSTFCFQSEIKTYGMIDFINEHSQLSISEDQSKTFQTGEIMNLAGNNESDEEDEFFQQSKKWQNSAIHLIQIQKLQSSVNLTKILQPIISELDSKTKNKLLSVDYTIIDQKIYYDNINQVVPTCEEYLSQRQIMSQYSKLYIQNYKDILEGDFCNSNQLNNFEFEAQKVEIIVSPEPTGPNGMSKKEMLTNLREKKNWHSDKEEKLTGSLAQLNISSHRATVTVMTVKQQEELKKQLPSPEIIENRLPPSGLKHGQFMNVSNFMKTSNKSIIGQYVLSAKSPKSPKSPQQSIRIKPISQHSQCVLGKKERDSSGSSQGKEVKMVKSYQQLPKMKETFTDRIRFIKKENSPRTLNQIQMLGSINSDQLQNDSLFDSVMISQCHQQSNVLFFLNQSGAGPESIKQKNLIIFDQMIKKSRSKKKIAALLIEHGMLDELKELMDENRNFNLNSQNEDGIPLISIAASSGYLEIVRFMLNYNLNINALDKDGNAPIHYAMMHNNYEVADLLIQNGANPRIKRIAKPIEKF